MSVQDLQRYTKIANSPRAWHFHVLDQFGVVFCTIPKNANRTIKRFLLDVASVDHQDVPDVDLHALCRSTIGLVRFSVEERADILFRFPIFAIVRNPYERIASAFSDRVVRPSQREPNLPMFEWVNGKGCGYEPGICFRDFIRYLAEHADDALDHHWRPQAVFLRGVDVEILGDVSSLHDSLTLLVERIGIDIAVPKDRPRSAAKPWDGECLADITSCELRQRGVLPPAEALYTQELRDIVAERYADDIRLMELMSSNRELGR